MGLQAEQDAAPVHAGLEADILNAGSDYVHRAKIFPDAGGAGPVRVVYFLLAVVLLIHFYGHPDLN